MSELSDEQQVRESRKHDGGHVAKTCELQQERIRADSTEQPGARLTRDGSKILGIAM